MTQRITVTKASGEQELFDEHKLRRSLANAGAKPHVIDSIVQSVNQMLTDGISTRKIYLEAFRLLRKQSSRSAGRYKLKEALLELGPSGYPFEQFISELLRRQGYETKTGVIADGHCVSHEIDVLAENDNHLNIIECKFHNRKGLTCDVKVPLYIHSRFNDIERNWKTDSDMSKKHHQGWVVTNTRFTGDAIKYGACAGLKMLSWDFPINEGLKNLIERVELHPITCLSSLSSRDKKLLLEQKVIFCSQLWENESLIDVLGVDTRKRNRILKEAHEISQMEMKNS